MEEFELDRKRNRRYSSAKRICCSRCFICCAVCLLVILIAALAGAYVVSRYIQTWGSDRENVTDLEQEEEFFETWRAPEHIRKAMPHALFGFDKTNQPVWFMNYGKYDFKSILADDANLEAVDLQRDQSVYRIQKSMKMRKKIGENQNLTWACITDMEGFSFSQAFDLRTLAYLQTIASQYEKFLETMDYTVVVNMNAFARYFVAAVSPFLGVIIEKVHIFGHDKEEWIPFILERIDRDQLPEEYGGYANFTPIATYYD